MKHPSLQLPIQQPDRFVWDVVVFFTIGLAAFEIPYSAAFPAPETPSGQIGRDLFFDLFFAIIFGIDIVLNALTARAESHAGWYGYRHIWGLFQPDQSPKAEKKRAGFRTRQLTTVRETSLGYVTSWWFWVDLLAAIPWGLLLFLANEVQMLSSLKIAVLPRLFRFLRFFRILKAGSALHLFRAGKNRFPGFGRFAMWLLFLPWLLHLQTCLYFAVAMGGDGTYFAAFSQSVMVLVAGESTEIESLSKTGHYVVWLGLVMQLLVISTAIGSLASQFISWDLKPRDRAKDYREGHTLLIGWNRWGPLLLEQLLSDDTTHKKDIVIAADMKPSLIWSALADTATGVEATNRIHVTRCGVLSIDNLTSLSIHTASRVLLTEVVAQTSEPLDAGRGVTMHDLMTLQCLLASCQAIEKYYPNEDDTSHRAVTSRVNLVASASSPASAKALRGGIPETLRAHSEIRVVDTSVIPARVYAQVILEPRLEPVFRDLVSYESCSTIDANVGGPEEGAEIYSHAIPAHHSGAYFDRWRMLSAPCIPIGFIDQDGEVHLNPKPHSTSARTPLGVGSKLLVLSSDQQALQSPKMRPSYKLVKQVPDRETDPHTQAQVSRRVLLLDSGGMNLKLASELAKFLTETSMVYMSGAVPEPQANTATFQSICDDDESNASLIEVVERLDDTTLGDVDTIVLTPHVRDEDTHDAILYMALAQLYHKIRRLKSEPKTDPQIIMQVRGSPNAALLEEYGNPCVFNPDRLVSHLMVQFADDVSRADVLTELFQPEGSELYLRDKASYVTADNEVLSFRQLRECAARRNELLIGWIDKEDTYRLAPSNADESNVEEMASLVVLAEN